MLDTVTDEQLRQMRERINTHNNELRRYCYRALIDEVLRLRGELERMSRPQANKVLESQSMPLFDVPPEEGDD